MRRLVSPREQGSHHDNRHEGILPDKFLVTMIQFFGCDAMMNIGDRIFRVFAFFETFIVVPEMSVIVPSRACMIPDMAELKWFQTVQI